MSELVMKVDLGSNERSLGERFVEHGVRLFCPKCLAEIADDPGYGLAFGGMGSYWVCDEEGCGWFYKEMDRDET